MCKRSSEYSYKVGNVCQDPQARTTKNGKTFYVFDIGVHHGDITEFMSISSWEKDVKKGDFIKVDGPVHIYKKRDGNLKPWMNAQHIAVLRRVPVQRELELCAST